MAKMKSKKKIVKSDGIDAQGRKGATVFFIIETLGLFIIVVIFNAFTLGYDGEPILFKRTIKEVSDIYRIDSTPENWAFSIWGFIYAYQFLWLMYGVSLICRRPVDGKGYLYFRPPYMPRALYITFGLSLLFIVMWLTFWTEEMLELSLLFLFFVAVTALCALGITVSALHRHQDELKRIGNTRDIVLTRALVHNGLGLYAIWTLLALWLNLGIVLVFEWDVLEIDATTVVLALIGASNALYFIIDIAVMPRHMPYLVTPYIVFPFATAAIFVREWDSSDRNYLFTLFLLGFAGFTALFKLGAIFSNLRNYPESDLRNSLYINQSRYRDEEKQSVDEFEDSTEESDLSDDYSDDDVDDDDDDDVEEEDEQSELSDETSEDEDSKTSTKNAARKARAFLLK